MSHTEPLPDDPTKTHVSESLLERLGDAVTEIDGTTDVKILSQRRPKRLRVTLNDGGIPDALHDVMNQYGGEIVDATSTGPGILTLDLAFRGRPRSTGLVKVSKWGGSLAATITREAREVTGFEQDQRLDVTARNGELVFRPWTPSDEPISADD